MTQEASLESNQFLRQLNLERKAGAEVKLINVIKRTFYPLIAVSFLKFLRIYFFSVNQLGDAVLKQRLKIVIRLGTFVGRLEYVNILATVINSEGHSFVAEQNHVVQTELLLREIRVFFARSYPLVLDSLFLKRIVCIQNNTVSIVSMNTDEVLSIFEFILLKVDGQLPGSVSVGQLDFLENADIGKSIQRDQIYFEISDIQVLFGRRRNGNTEGYLTLLAGMERQNIITLIVRHQFLLRILSGYNLSLYYYFLDITLELVQKWPFSEIKLRMI